MTAPRILPAERLGDLFAALDAAGYDVWGPTERDGAVVLAPIDRIEALPRGRAARQDGGVYRMEASGDTRWFAATHGPHSGKTLFHPANVRLWRAERRGDGIEMTPDDHRPAKPIAFFGARACDVAAVLIQDRTLAEGAMADPVYAARRASAFIVAAHCAEPARVCFCASMDAGPRARTGFDLALGELLDAAGHRFLVEVGSAAGADLIDGLGLAPAGRADLEAIDRQAKAAAAAMGRTLDAEAARSALPATRESDQWEEVVERCLTCGACVMSCPTCFCTTSTETTDVAGEAIERHRLWDGCFSLDFTHMQGGPARATAASRYRHWITHKLSTWHDQFDTAGCVGCGRCIAWCPVGIDITAEAARAIRFVGGVDGEET